MNSEHKKRLDQEKNRNKLQAEIFQLWRGVLNNDKDSKKKFVKIYLDIFPNNEFLTKELSKKNLHIMYLHLTS